MVKVAELTGHPSRVLHMAQSPDGTTVVTAAADETLRFWKILSGGDVSSTLLEPFLALPARMPTHMRTLPPPLHTARTHTQRRIRAPHALPRGPCAFNTPAIVMSQDAKKERAAAKDSVLNQRSIR